MVALRKQGLANLKILWRFMLQTINKRTYQQCQSEPVFTQICTWKYRNVYRFSNSIVFLNPKTLELFMRVPEQMFF